MKINWSFFLFVVFYLSFIGWIAIQVARMMGVL